MAAVAAEAVSLLHELGGAYWRHVLQLAKRSLLV